MWSFISSCYWIYCQNKRYLITFCEGLLRSKCILKMMKCPLLSCLSFFFRGKLLNWSPSLRWTTPGRAAAMSTTFLAMRTKSAPRTIQRPVAALSCRRRHWQCLLRVTQGEGRLWPSFSNPIPPFLHAVKHSSKHTRKPNKKEHWNLLTFMRLSFSFWSFGHF